MYDLKFNILGCLKSCIRAQAQNKHPTVFYFSLLFKEKSGNGVKSKHSTWVCLKSARNHKFHNFCIKFG